MSQDPEVESDRASSPMEVSPPSQELSVDEVSRLYIWMYVCVHSLCDSQQVRRRRLNRLTNLGPLRSQTTPTPTQTTPTKATPSSSTSSVPNIRRATSVSV